MRDVVKHKILDTVADQGECELDELLRACQAFTWNQVFMAVDELSRTGHLQLKARGAGVYQVAMAQRRPMPGSHEDGMKTREHHQMAKGSASDPAQKLSERARREHVEVLIARRASELFTERGARQGRFLEDWFEAEREIVSRMPAV